MPIYDTIKDNISLNINNSSIRDVISFPHTTIFIFKVI